MGGIVIHKGIPAALATALLFLMSPAAAPAQVQASSQTGAITGSVHTSSNAPVTGATVDLSGPVNKHTSTDASGGFSFAGIPAGIYRLDITKGGFITATDTDLTVLAGSSVPVQVTLQAADLSSLRTIARIVSTATSSINTGTAATNITGRAQFQTTASPQINEVVQRIPGMVVQHGSSSPNTSFSLAGSQGYETQVLIDGHPISAGRYGVWFSQFLNSFLVQNVETQIGPGNTTPFAGTAVGGTANIVTPQFSAQPSFEMATGVDTLLGSYTNMLTSNRFGKLSTLVGAQISGVNTSYTGTYGCVLDPNNKSTWNTPGATGVISFCGDLGGAQYNKGEIVKGGWSFSPTTSLELTYLGSQGGYLPQGSAYGIYSGPITIAQCITVSGHQECTNPNQSQYIGRTINGFFFYPGSNVHNNMPLFEGQFRTALGDNTLLIRPYAGNILRYIDGSGESNYNQWFYPNGQNSKYCSGGPTYGTPQQPGADGFTACQEGPYTTIESDKLKGNTLTFIHPMGLNTLSFNWDYHSDETYAAAGDPLTVPFPVVVPDTTAKYNSLSLIGDFSLNPKLTMRTGFYESLWNLNGSQTGPFVGGKPTTIGLDRTVGRFDPHIAFTLQPTSGTSYRLSFGTSTTFPYAGEVSGNSALIRASGTGSAGNTLQQKNPDLQPERATELDLGVDKRLGSAILSLDLNDTQIANVFETLTTPVANNPNYTAIFQPVNAANLSNQFALITLRDQPSHGFGYYATVTIARSVPHGIPLGGSSFSIPANGVQQCSDGGSAVCIPYSKGYGALEYTAYDGTFLHLGMDYEGKNNTYFQPPFALFDFAYRHPLTKKFDVQLSVYNVFNTNRFGGLVTPNAGTPISGENGSGQYGQYKASLPFPLIPVDARTARIQIQYHVGR
jgi:outer membrane receptor protein involved in Fe transport